MTSTIKQITNNSENGYCKMPDGTLMQWGSLTVPSGSYTATANFPMAFIDRTQLGITLTPTISQAGVVYNVNYQALTTSVLSVGRTPNTAASTYYYIAVGRWK